MVQTRSPSQKDPLFCSRCAFVLRTSRFLSTVLLLLLLLLQSARGLRISEGFAMGSKLPDAKTDPNSYQNDDRTLYHLPPPPRCERHHTERDDYDLDALATALETDGVVVLPDVYSKEQIEAFREAHSQNFSIVTKLMAGRDVRPIDKPYRHDFDTKRYYLMPHYSIEDEETGESDEVIEISPGRLDYTFGMNPYWDDDEEEEEEEECGDEKNPFASLEFRRPKILAELMDRMLRSDYKSYAGALPVSAANDNDSDDNESNSNVPRDGPWHRDVYLLFDDETVDVGLPHPYYFTVLIPLVETSAENGATEFLLGSHRQTCGEALQRSGNSFQPRIQPGSVVVFDGRICHRGRGNNTREDRTVLYMVWTKRWYNDY
ncbi:unnamed protein product [Pseudo-nitzschia multistriata]|uniref:Uncharacterized protein n=1 Tax=Pseudo-nitzschia multistriata TaxID=183589 RepID=A0A448Z0Q4_9STRA|nr:unnamed protein product [Pseudo-nitzschia multistriata]